MHRNANRRLAEPHVSFGYRINKRRCPSKRELTTRHHTRLAGCIEVLSTAPGSRIARSEQPSVRDRSQVRPSSCLYHDPLSGASHRCPNSQLSISAFRRDTWPSACGKVAMRCTKCGTENAVGKKFCCQCGSLLSSHCPKCGAENAPASRFCGNCGAALAGNAEQSALLSSRTGSAAPDVRVTAEQLAFLDLRNSSRSKPARIERSIDSVTTSIS